MKRRGVFITGTDTGVGKTLVSAVCLTHWQGQYWKPVQTGPEKDHDQPYIQRLTSLDKDSFYPEQYVFPDPLSPHIAAENCGETICFNDIIRRFQKMQDRGTDKPLIVEGAGGVMVPLNSKHMLIDLIEALGLPVIIVCRTALGTINHSLLTLAALRQRQLPIAGVVFSGPEHPKEMKSICDLGNVSQLAHFPVMEKIDMADIRYLGTQLPKWSDMPEIIAQNTL